MNSMTMKEACAFITAKRSRNQARHLTIVAAEGYCKQLNDREYKKVLVKQKQSFVKGKGYSNRGLWNHNNLSKIELKTLY